MWMVFNKFSSGKGASYMGGAVTSTASSISMQNAELCIGSTGSWADLRVIYFLSDGAAVYRTDSYTGASNIANRNTAIGVGDDSLQNLVNNTVNDVAMTVLPNAPIDPATGLPVPTIAVATAGGVSVIKDDGTVVDNTTSTYNTGWMNGDIKGAFLSDTDDTDLVGSGELVTNGTFDTDTTGWIS
jgi:trimeric autotransporter adhesin